MKNLAAALRLARALEGACDTDQDVARAADEMAAVARIMATDTQIAAILTTPAVEASRRKAFVDSLARAAGLSPRTIHFLKILIDQKQAAMIPLVADAIGTIRDRRMGIVEAEVTTAQPLAPETAERARQTIEKKVGRKVRLTTRTDPGIIGGMVARVGSTVYDGSIRTRLATLRSRLSER